MRARIPAPRRKRAGAGPPERRQTLAEPAAASRPRPQIPSAIRQGVWRQHLRAVPNRTRARAPVHRDGGRANRPRPRDHRQRADTRRRAQEGRILDGPPGVIPAENRPGRHIPAGNQTHSPLRTKCRQAQLLQSQDPELIPQRRA